MKAGDLLLRSSSAPAAYSPTLDCNPLPGRLQLAAAEMVAVSQRIKTSAGQQAGVHR